MKKKKYVLVSMVVILGILFIIRYLYINKDAPKKFEINDYEINEEVKLDNINIIIDSFNIEDKYLEEDQKEYRYGIVKFKVKGKEIDNNEIRYLFENSKLSYDIRWQDCGESDEISREINNDETIITYKVSYQLNFLKDNEVLDKNKFKFYIAKDLYKGDIVKKFQEGKLYGKCINL